MRYIDSVWDSWRDKQGLPASMVAVNEREVESWPQTCRVNERYESGIATCWGGIRVKDIRTAAMQKGKDQLVDPYLHVWHHNLKLKGIITQLMQIPDMEGVMSSTADYILWWILTPNLLKRNLIVHCVSTADDMVHVWHYQQLSHGRVVLHQFSSHHGSHAWSIDHTVITGKGFNPTPQTLDNWDNE